MPVSVSRHPPTASACPADRPSSGSVLRLKLAYRYWHMIRCSSCDASISRLHRCSRFSTTSSGSDIGAPNMVALSPPSRLTSLHADATAEGAACTIPGWLPARAAGGKMRRMSRALRVIGVPCSAGAHHAGLERGPAALRAAGLLDRLRRAGYEVSDAGDLAPRVFTADTAHPRARNRDAVVQACRDVAGATGQAIAAGRIPVLLGGDCSITAGAVAGCLSQRPDTGLLYLDGDCDLRTPQTTIAGNFDGMVIAALLGEGDPGYIGLAGTVPTLPPE